MDLFYIAFATFFAFICYKMAENRGRNPTLGAIAGFFFNLFAVIYYLIVGKSPELKNKVLNHAVKRNQQSESNSSEETQDGKKKCPYCAEEIKQEAIKCKHCESNLK